MQIASGIAQKSIGKFDRTIEYSIESGNLIRFDQNSTRFDRIELIRWFDRSPMSNLSTTWVVEYFIDTLVLVITDDGSSDSHPSRSREEKQQQKKRKGSLSLGSKDGRNYDNELDLDLLVQIKCARKDSDTKEI
jgi:hypothetical protein